MNKDSIVVEVTFSPRSEPGSDERNGIFVFTIPDLIVARSELFSLRYQRGPRKGKDFLRERNAKANFDWNLWVDPNEHTALVVLLGIGLGRVLCKACNAEYTNSDLLLYDWAEQNHGGQQYTCPKEHILFTLQTHWGEFFGDDKRSSVRVRHVPGTTVADVFDNR